MNAVITIDRLRLHARIGVDDQEISVGNEYEVTAAITYPVGPSALLHDRLDGTLNYAVVIEIIKEVMVRPCALLEYAATAIIEALKSRFPAISALTVTVAKLAPPVPSTSLSSVSVTITA